jgi:hypothetical protein
LGRLIRCSSWKQLYATGDLKGNRCRDCSFQNFVDTGSVGFNEKAAPFMTLLFQTLNLLKHYQGATQFI